MVERKSSQANSPTEVYTIEDIQSSGVPYVGATQDVDLGEYELKAGQIELDQSPTGTAGVAVTRWNNTIGSTETTLKGGSVLLKNGVDLVARVVNKVSPNATLTKAAYQVVKVSGAQGQRLAVDYAQANNDNNSADTLGVVIETIPTNQEGFIMTVGQLEGINTTGSLQGESWADGDVLYLSPTTPGAVTKVKPNGSTGHIVIIGYVEYAHANNGKIYVKIMNGWELDELHNVYINPATLANNQVLTYNSSTSLWNNKALPIEIQVAASDETTALTTGTAKVTFRTPCAMTVTSVRASLSTAQTSGNIFTVDINEGGNSILSTKLTIDNTERTSVTAATQPVISDTALADDAEMTIDIDQVGDGTAKGLKVTIIGTRA
jgi:nitrogen fixation protein